jgi:hypothetical protein
MSVGVRSRRFSVEEYHQMVRAGILARDPGTRVKPSGHRGFISTRRANYITLYYVNAPVNAVSIRSLTASKP